jgi:hypothetical protein
MELNRYGEVAGTTRPNRWYYRWFYSGWPKLPWRWLSYSFRWQLINEWDAYENTPEFLDYEWEEFKKRSTMDLSDEPGRPSWFSNRLGAS